MSSRTGNGAWCPVHPEHGRMLVLGDGVQYCPAQGHDKDKTPALYMPDGKTPLHRDKA